MTTPLVILGAVTGTAAAGAYLRWAVRPVAFAFRAGVRVGVIRGRRATPTEKWEAVQRLGGQ